jgi:hypothetical protein
MCAITSAKWLCKRPLRNQNIGAKPLGVALVFLHLTQIKRYRINWNSLGGGRTHYDNNISARNIVAFKNQIEKAAASA